MNFMLKKSILSEARLSFLITKQLSNVVHHFTLLMNNSVPHLQWDLIWYSTDVAKPTASFRKPLYSW